MKNLKLLLATTAMLSMGTMVANATPATATASQSETINMDVTFVRSYSLSEDKHLNFGVLINPRAGDSVQIGASNDTPTVTGTTTIANFSSGKGVPHRGSFYIVMPGDTLTAPTGYHYDLVFGANSIDLTDGTTTCGQVTNLNMGAGVTTLNKTVYYGGTFTVDESMTSSNFYQGSCTGSTTVTLVLIDNAY